MSEIRTDPLTGQRVIIAANRAHRPHEFQRQAVRRGDAVCPFCSGHEQDTPEAIACYEGWEPGPASNDWQLRVIPNLYPALSEDAPENLAATPDEAHSTFQAQPGLGAHEVFVEARQHLVSFTELTRQQAHRTLIAYRDRLQFHGENPKMRYGQLFKNVRPEAGASIEHTHSQLLVLPYVPLPISLHLEKGRHYFQAASQCLLCDLVRHESSLGKRLVRESDHFIALCPYAARFPYLMWVLPRQHHSHFETMTFGELGELAELLSILLKALEETLINPAYNYAIRTAPFDTGSVPYYHWSIELFPRLTNLAGFEFATGCYVNHISPESAANQLRDWLASK